MKKKFLDKKGFTLAELLIVVAIIGVLVAISIPVFTAQLEKAREATDAANIRSAYAECTAELLTNESADLSSYTVKATQTKANWQMNGDSATLEIGGQNVNALTSGNYTFSKGTDGEVVINSGGTSGGGTTGG